MDQSTIFRIKKTGERIRTAADVTCNMSGKRIISAKKQNAYPYGSCLGCVDSQMHKECSNVFLDRRIIRAKALSLYRRCADMATEDTQCEDEGQRSATKEFKLFAV